MKIILLGAGNVATHLGHALKKAGHDILQVYSRSASSAKELTLKLHVIPVTEVAEISPHADIYMTSISDSSLPAFIKSFPIINKTIVHTSGSVGISVFGKKFKTYGVLYPLQTFSKERKINFAEVPVLLEGNNSKSLGLIKSVADSISPHVFETDSATRKTIHLAAVIANNFTNHLFVQAEKILAKKNIPFPILGPLLHETVIKAIHLSPSESQTGPAKRGDTKIIEEHMKMLKKDSSLSKIYKLMSESIEKESGMKL
jgi:predicted short-subunit dehydrogenase-like oxidoreductase (DUF2520 family)